MARCKKKKWHRNILRTMLAQASGKTSNFTATKTKRQKEINKSVSLKVFQIQTDAQLLWAEISSFWIIKHWNLFLSYIRLYHINQSNIYLYKKLSLVAVSLIHLGFFSDRGGKLYIQVWTNTYIPLVGYAEATPTGRTGST